MYAYTYPHICICVCVNVCINLFISVSWLVINFSQFCTLRMKRRKQNEAKENNPVVSSAL